MDEELDALLAEFRADTAALQDLQQVEAAKTQYLGRKGRVTDLMKNMRNVPKEERAAVGKAVNALKAEMEAALDAARAELERAALNAKLDSEWLDVTLSPSPSQLGGLHPVSRVQYEIEDIFRSLGFAVLDGPHVELDYYNFEALNIPADHPARDMQDTFYFENGAILRTHTSAIQVRGMERLEPPFRIIGPGKVFRVERTDASHEAAFHQLEGMVVGENITVANLIDCMKTLLAEIFKREVKVRLRPGYFPFVEPGFELDISCLICSGDGCSVCKQSGWVELMPCGLVHPNVLRAGNIDPAAWSGFAFGLGLDRLAMMRYNIEDIRLIHSADLRFSGQFA
jgi:phenylalanyl-tRNA synthetase alpha chain